MKKCPYCAEEIQDAAVVCRYCKHDLPMGNSVHSAPEPLPKITGAEEIASYISDLRRKYFSDKRIVELLIEKGIDRDKALIIMGMDAPTIERNKKAAVEAGEKMMGLGFLLFIVGVLVTFISFSGAESGGKYVVAIGAMFWGLDRIIRGWNLKRKAK